MEAKKSKKVLKGWQPYTNKSANLEKYTDTDAAAELAGDVIGTIAVQVRLAEGLFGLASVLWENQTATASR